MSDFKRFRKSVSTVKSNASRASQASMGSHYRKAALRFPLHLTFLNNTELFFSIDNNCEIPVYYQIERSPFTVNTFEALPTQGIIHPKKRETIQLKLKTCNKAKDIFIVHWAPVNEENLNGAQIQKDGQTRTVQVSIKDEVMNCLQYQKQPKYLNQTSIDWGEATKVRDASYKKDSAEQTLLTFWNLTLTAIVSFLVGFIFC